MTSGELQHLLLNDYQRGFPLTARPFATVGRELGIEEGRVIELLKGFTRSGEVSRVGAVFRPNTIGVSTLAAVSVADADVEATADMISAFSEVNHNYEREHRYNIWFVVTAPDRARLQAVLDEIQRRAGSRVLSLPLMRDYYIDLGFDLGSTGREGLRRQRRAAAPPGNPAAYPVGGSLIRALQPGLPLVRAPYAAIAERAGIGETEVIESIRGMQRTGVIKRFGVIVRHRELGYRANAMCVWDVADERADDLGRRMARMPFVNLCYRRARARPEWAYNLYCMIHGKERDWVADRLKYMKRELGLNGSPGAVLFSTRRFKQRGALYGAERSAGRGEAPRG